MKKQLYLFAALLLFACSESTQLAQEIVEEVRTEYVPDKRVAIFEVETVGKAGEVQLNGATNLPQHAKIC